MLVNLLAHSESPERLVAYSAKLCYAKGDINSLTTNLTDEAASNFVDMLSEIGHASPTEHANFTFGIEGVSRSLLAQLTRHRLASYSVQSQRYVTENAFEFVVPPEIAECGEAHELFLQAMKDDQEIYDRLTAILEERHFENLKYENSEKEARKKARKIAIEDARFVLPNACATKLICTMNARSLHNFFEHRCCMRAQWEIRELAEKMLILCKEVAPHLFKSAGPKCISAPCPEGKMTCGKISEIREKYKNLARESIDVG